jgi:hypothetical protein
MQKATQNRISRITHNDEQTLYFLIEQANTFSRVDIRTKNRERDTVYARKAFMWMAKKKYGIKLSYIGAAVNLRHDTATYHIRTAQEWIDQNDKEFITLLNKTFNTIIKPVDAIAPFASERTLQNDIRVLKESVGRLKPFLSVLNDIPDGREQDVADRLQLFIKTLTMDTDNNITKVYEGHSAFLQD